MTGLTEDERDRLRDWWDEDTTASVESSFPIIARILNDHEQEAAKRALVQAAEGVMMATGHSAGVPVWRADIANWLLDQANRQMRRIHPTQEKR